MSDEPRLVNLTGHDITVIGEGRRRHTLESDGSLRVDSQMEEVGTIRVGNLDVPLLEIVEQRLPPIRREDGTYYIVSGIVAARARRRDDFLVPARVVRIGNDVDGCRAFALLKRGNGHDR